MSTTQAAGRTPSGGAPELTPREMGRWTWRQLTSMRTALVLLLLLALAAVPGSVVPQEKVDPFAVSRWKQDHPDLTRVYEWLGLFDVYSTVWFSAIYLLLMVSLLGCIVPRTAVYWRAMRARPPRTPRNLSRLPASRRVVVDAEPAEALARAAEVLRSRRYRVDTRPAGDGEIGSVAAERGHLREAGNLVFHVSVVVVLLAVAYGSLFGYRGGVIVVAGQGFANSLSQYDEFVPGALFDSDELPPFSLTVEDFDVAYQTSGEQAGSPTHFSAALTYRESPSAPERSYDLRVNHPLQLPGASVFLVGNGYAPRITVRDGNGDVAASGPVVFLPQDPSFASFGVVKVPDARPEQIGFEGLFLPTYGFTMERGPFSAFPDALDPVLTGLVYRGDLGLDDGDPQSVYVLDKDRLDVFTREDGSDFRADLRVGETVELPDGGGTITFDGVDRWVKLQISDTPGKGVALGGVVVAILGLLASLFVRPRRAWVRVSRAEEHTMVEVAGLDRTEGGDLAAEVDALTAEIQQSPRQRPARVKEKS